LRIWPSSRLLKILTYGVDQFFGEGATVNAFTADGLFIGQSAAFFTTLMNLAKAADAAQRGF